MGFQVIGLLYGADFGDAMCITVNCGYDTDSSGGTIGSWVGIIEGSDAGWASPVIIGCFVLLGAGAIVSGIQSTAAVAH